MSRIQNPAELAVAVMTFKSVETIALDGGSQSWRLDANHIGTFEYAILCRCTTRYAPQDARSHRTAFAIGRVSDIVPSTEPHNNPPRDGKRRWLFRFSEMAEIDLPAFWEYGRWPTVIRTLKEFRVDPSDYDFRPLASFLGKSTQTEEENALEAVQKAPVSFSDIIASHKGKLAEALGIRHECIDISVRF